MLRQAHVYRVFRTTQAPGERTHGIARLSLLRRATFRSHLFPGSFAERSSGVTYSRTHGKIYSSFQSTPLLFASEEWTISPFVSFDRSTHTPADRHNVSLTDISLILIRLPRP